MKVFNINGRRQSSCQCGSWLDHWAKVGGRPIPEHCAAVTCMTAPQLGVHVQIENETENYWWIIPLCLKHSVSAASLEIDDSTVLVSAHVIENCGKPVPVAEAVEPQGLPKQSAPDTTNYEKDLARAKELRGHSDTTTFRSRGKRKARQEDPPALELTY